MTDKQFYDNQQTAVERIRLTANHYNIGVIEADAALIQIMGALADMDKRGEEIKESVESE